jgi:hypothetical protein
MVEAPVFCRRVRPKVLARRGAVIAVVLLCTAATASASVAATLHVDVAQTTVKENTWFDVKLTGSFRKSETPRGRAWLIPAVQFSPKPCLATAQAENANRPSAFYFGEKGGVFESHSPIARDDSLKLHRVGSFRICAYLYAKLVRTSDTTKPIARAERSFKSVK